MAAMLLATLLYVERSDAQAVITRAQGSWTRELSKLRSIRDTETGKAQKALRIQSALRTAFQPAQPLSDVATAIGDAMPPSVWLTGLSIDRGKPVQIRGTAALAGEVARLVDDLGNTPRFRDVKLVFANSARIDEKPVVQFSITAMPVGNLPMHAPSKTKKKAVRAKTSKATEDAVSGGAK
jgi:Tfp pilus assembly protein PilN